MRSIDHHQLEQLASTVARCGKSPSCGSLLTQDSLRSGQYSDFTIRCSDGNSIPVHRAIVCPRSKVISAAINGVFKVRHCNQSSSKFKVVLLNQQLGGSIARDLPRRGRTSHCYEDDRLPVLLGLQRPSKRRD